MKRISGLLSALLVFALLLSGCNTRPSPASSTPETAGSTSLSTQGTASAPASEASDTTEPTGETAPAAPATDDGDGRTQATSRPSTTVQTTTTTSTSAVQQPPAGDYGYDFGSGSAPLLDDPLGKAFLQGVFPSGGAPAGDQAGFTLTVDKTDFEQGVWHSRWDEKEVFRVQLANQNNADNPYTIRIGQGGQLYSLKTKAGELMPPQTADNAWVDDCLLLTFLDYGRNFMNSAGNPSLSNLSGFIHQAGMYPYEPEIMKENTGSELFFAPVVAEHWDASKNQYSCISLGMPPVGPAYNRGDVLMYTSIRDIGDGVFEMQYMTYNYNWYYNANDPSQITSPVDRYQVDVTAWGGHRKSVFPWIVAGVKGNPASYENPFGGDTQLPAWGSGAAGTTIMDPTQTGGWFAGVQRLGDNSAYAMSWIVGDKNTSDKYAQMFVMGDASGTDASGHDRDFEVMNLNFRGNMTPGTVFYFRYYYSVGDIGTVAQQSAKYKDYCVAQELVFEEETTPTVPLYLTTMNNQTVLSETGSGDPAMYVYAYPVKNSLPLYLIRNRTSNRLHVTSDPYMLMERVTLENDYQSPKRTGVRPYDGTTEIVKLLGYVLPESEADTSLSYRSLSSVLTDQTYYPQLGIYDKNIVVRTDPN